MLWLGCLSVFKWFDVFGVIRLKGKAGFLAERFLGVFIFLEPRLLFQNVLKRVFESFHF